MLSLPPRFDLFTLRFPKNFIPKEIQQKYDKILNKYNSPIRSSIDFLNEGIVSVAFPGINESIITQQQTGYNNDINRHEPSSEVVYRSTSNPLELINRTLSVTFLHKQGFVNYFMLYEIWFHYFCKSTKSKESCLDMLYIEILDSSGKVIAQLEMYDIFFSSMDGLEFDFSKISLSDDTFTANFNFNNLNFDFSNINS